VKPVRLISHKIAGGSLKYIVLDSHQASSAEEEIELLLAFPVAVVTDGYPWRDLDVVDEVACPSDVSAGDNALR